MLKPIAAGLMCLGFVTLGVAISQGQDDETDLIVIEGKVNATEVTADELKQQPATGVTFTAGGGAYDSGPAPGGEAGVTVDGQRFRVVRAENGSVAVYSQDGKLVEQHDAGATPGRLSARFTRLAQGQQVVDPQTRESLEKMAAGLKEQIQKLQSEGKQDEARQKAMSLGAIEGLLRGNAQYGGVHITRRSADPKQTMEEVQKLHARMRLLTEEAANLPEDAADKRRKIKQEMELTHMEIAKKQQAMAGPNPFGGQPGQPGFGSGQPFESAVLGMMAGPPHGFGPSAGAALLRKSEALSHAAAQLKSNGLDEQAQPLEAKAQQLRAEAQKMMQDEAEKRRAQGAAQGGFGRGFPGGIGGGPPMDLHRSIHELQEQIQQLRKEVGELRELLQRKQ